MLKQKPKRGAPRRPRQVRELAPGELEAMAEQIIGERGTKRTGVDTRAAVRHLIRVVHRLTEEIAALRRTVELQGKLSPQIADRPYLEG